MNLLFQSKGPQPARRKYKVEIQAGRQKYCIVDEFSHEYEALSRHIEIVKKGDVTDWSVVEKIDIEGAPTEYSNVGLVNFNFNIFSEEAVSKDNPHFDHPFGKLLMRLWPGDCKKQIINMNYLTKKENPKRIKTKQFVLNQELQILEDITEHEF